MARHHVMIAGGGIAAIEAALGLRELAPEEVRVTLLAPTYDLVHQPLDGSPWTLGGVRRYPLASVADALGVEHVQDTLTGVKPDVRRIVTRSSGELPYDALVVAVGARPALALNRAMPLSGRLNVPAAEFALELVRGGWSERPSVVVPAGHAWTLPAYEIALHAIQRAGVHPVVVTSEAAPAQAFGQPAAGALSDALRRAGIRVLTETVVEDFEPGALRLADGSTVEVTQVVALPRLRGPRIAGLPADADGFIPTDAFGAVEGVPGVWAAGDATTFAVRQGGIAAQQGAVVAAGVARAAGADADPYPLQPVLRGALAVPDGMLHLEHDLPEGRSTASSEPLWHPPHRIAGVRLHRLVETLERPSG